MPTDVSALKQTQQQDKPSTCADHRLASPNAKIRGINLPTAKIITLQLFVALFTFLAVPAAAQTNYELDYLVTVPDPASGTAQVTMWIRGTGAEQALTITEIPDTKYATMDVLEIHAYKSDGEKLGLTRDPASGRPSGWNSVVTWKMQHAGSDSVRVEYKVAVNDWGVRDPGLSYMEVNYIGKDWAACRGASLLLVPLTGSSVYGNDPVSKMRVRFSLPEGWNVFTPWSPEDDGYSPIFDNPNPRENWVLMVGNTSIAMGNFHPYRQQFGNTEVTVAVYGGWSEAERDRLAQESLAVYQYYYNVFGINSAQRYLIIMNPLSDDGSRICTGKYSNSTGMYGEYNQWLGYIQISHWLFNHNMSHHWNQFSFGFWGLKDQGEWMVEGATVFYEVKVCDALGFGSGNELEDRLREYSQRYMDEYVNQGSDRAIDGRDGVTLGHDEFFDYRKPVLVMFLLAKEIAQRTNGTKTFNGFMNYFYQKYKNYTYGVDCDAYTVLAELGVYTGSDFTQFFEDYIFGTTTVDVSWGYGDDDGDGVSNAMEIALDTNPWAGN